MAADVFAAAMSRLPNPGEMVLSDRIALFPGGNALNTAVALQRLGVRTSFFGALGDDAFGDIVISELEKIGLDTRAVIRAQGQATPTTLIYRAEGEDRRFIHALGGANQFTGEDLPLDLVPTDGIVVAAGYMKLPLWNDQALLELFRQARERRSRVVLNVCIPWQTSVDAGRCLRLLPHVDVFIANEDEARVLTGKADLDSQARVLRQEGAPLVVITRGAGGLFARNAECTVEMSVFRVPLVDPTGCGDCFNAGLVAAILRGWDLVKTLKFGSAVGALGATALGCTTGVPSFEAVEKFLGENEVECRVIVTDRGEFRSLISEP